MIKPGEAEVLGVEVVQTGCHCSFRLEIEYWQGGEFSTATIPRDEDEPFSVMGISPKGYDVVYVDNSNFAGMERVQRFDCRVDRSTCDEFGGFGSP